MDYNQVGQQKNINDDRFFTSGSGEDFQSEVTQPEYNLNSDQNSWGNSYQNQGNKALGATFERPQSVEQFPNNEVIDLTTKNIELTMPPVAEQITSTEQTIEEVAPRDDFSVVKTKENLSKEAIAFIEKKNHDFYTGKISPEQFYSDTRRLMLANLDNSYGRKIAS